MPTVTPFLWFDDQLEAALARYAEVFDDFEVVDVRRWPDAMPERGGQVMSARFRLLEQEVMALNGGPHYTLTPAFSLFVACDGQDEIDRYWNALVEGGTPLMCGWLTDRFGVSWQIIPSELDQLLGDPDPERAGRATQAMLTMVKLDLAALRAAAAADG
jgi:predicted 3-demethylubiquinone-9 3-methyltransferase (glyoxalase superfamily)